MSTPPVPPPVPNDPEPGTEPGTQRYGAERPAAHRSTGSTPPRPAVRAERTPVRAERAPVRRRTPPQYGQNAPQYGQNPPQYGSRLPRATGSSRTGSPPTRSTRPSSRRPAGSAGRSPAGQHFVLAAHRLGRHLRRLRAHRPHHAGRSADARDVFDKPGRSGSGAGRSRTRTSRVSSPAHWWCSPLLAPALYALVAFFVRKGKNWARILGTVFAALSVLGLFQALQPRRPSAPCWGSRPSCCCTCRRRPVLPEAAAVRQPLRRQLGNPYGR